MLINKIKHYIIFVAVFFCWVGVVEASVIINEVQISPTEERFIELYNNGSSSVDLTDWYLQRKTATGSSFGSLVSKTSFSGKSVGAGEYFLISKGSMSGSDIELDNLTLTESNTIQLKNSEQEVISKVGWGEANDCENECASNPTSGKSIQRISGGSWIMATPTPGDTNSGSGSDDEEIDNGEDNTDDSTATISKKDELAILRITTKIISPKIVVAGVSFPLSSLTTSNRGVTYAVGKFVWNFGDGRISEVEKSGPYEYMYEYPGEYVLTLSYFDNNFTLIPEATDKITIKVIESEVFISRVGDSVDPFIEIENKSKYEVLLSNWIITAGMHYFKIPEGTTLLSGKKIKLSPKITGFVADDLKSIVITNPNNFVIATYPTKTKKAVTKKSGIVSTTTYNNSISPENNLPDDSLLEDSQVINLNDLGASVSGTGVNISNLVYTLTGLVVIIGLGITSFLLIKKKDDTPDYVEKQIRAEDIKIIE